MNWWAMLVVIPAGICGATLGEWLITKWRAIQSGSDAGTR